MRPLISRFAENEAIELKFYKSQFFYILLFFRLTNSRLFATERLCPEVSEKNVRHLYRTANYHEDIFITGLCKTERRSLRHFITFHFHPGDVGWRRGQQYEFPLKFPNDVSIGVGQSETLSKKTEFWERWQRQRRVVLIFTDLIVNSGKKRENHNLF